MININKLAIIICNFNKSKYLIKCIKAVKNSTYNNYDLYVVDNASSDDSVAQVKKNFKEDELTLIENKENLGGSGGFNTGLREALKGSYKYIMLLDNDAMVEEKSIEKAIEYLEENNDVGMLGFKLYSMDNPTQIQEFGADIDFHNFNIKPYYKGYVDNDNIPFIKECDYVPACAVIVRKEAVLKAGLMPEENFIYWDDIEWGYLFKQNGYKVIAYSGSKAWHKMGVKQKINTFGTYYFWRNRVRFFMKHCNKEQKSIFAEKLFNEISQSICMCNYNKKYNSASTILQAVFDALYGISGKAKDNKIMPSDIIEDKLHSFISKYNKVAIIHNTNVLHTADLIEKIKFINEKIDIEIISEDKESVKGLDNVKVISCNQFKKSQDGLIIETCSHITELIDGLKEINHMYVDVYFNCIYDNEDLKRLKSLKDIENMLRNILYPVIRNVML